jgi:hypothetical protein
MPTGVPRAAVARQDGRPGARRAFVRGVIVKDFPVVKDLLRISVENPSQPEKFTENLASYEM